MTNEFKYRFTNCKSCRYNYDTGAKYGECGECDKCSNYRHTSDTIECRCLETATDAETCPYYKEYKDGTNS